jgi:hypothetical protein
MAQTHADIVSALERARVFGDIYRTPLPRILSPLPRPDIFARYAPENGAEQANANGRMRPDGKMDWDFYRLDHHLLDAVDQVRFAEKGTYTKQFNVTARRQVAERLDPDRLHPDSIYNPSMRVYMCASESPTLAVSHADTLAILSNHAPRLLDLAIDEDNIGDFMATARCLAPVFGEAAKPLPANTVAVMAGGTFHMRPDDTAKGRVFLRAHAFAAD